MWYQVFVETMFIGKTSACQSQVFSVKWRGAFFPVEDRWTVLELGSSTFEGQGPSFCDPAAAFEAEDLEPIAGQLRRSWTILNRNSPVDDLWCQEWSKHGPWARLVPELNSARKYFSKGLEHGFSSRFPNNHVLLPDLPLSLFLTWRG